MKRLTLAAAAAITVAAPLPLAAPAHAQCGNCAQEITQLRSWASQALSVARQIEQAAAQYRMLVSTYDAIAHATNVQGIASALGGVTRTYMPEASEMMGLAAGSGSIYGIANDLRTLGRYADVGDESPWAQEMQRRELVTANIKAIAHAGLESAQESVTHLGEYLGLISEAEDGTAVSAVGNGVAVEQQNLLHHQAQIQQVQIMLATEDRVERQRAEQMQWESARQMFEDSGQLGGGE